MPFQKKKRRCEKCMDKWVYKPVGKRITSLELEKVFMDELEAMRLCDGLNLSQKEAADLMEVSTGTLQRLVYSARKKIVDALCNDRAIELEIPDNITFNITSEAGEE